MSYKNTAGTTLDQAGLLALTTVKTLPEIRVFTANVYETFTHPGAKEYEGDRRLKYRVGQEVPTSVLQGLYTLAQVASIAPATGGIAGGTAVTLKGAGFAGATGATVGGVPLTNFKVVDDATITGLTGAHAAGAVPIVLTDDGGNVTTGNLFTYV